MTQSFPAEDPKHQRSHTRHTDTPFGVPFSSKALFSQHPASSENKRGVQFGFDTVCSCLLVGFQSTKLTASWICQPPDSASHHLPRGCQVVGSNLRGDVEWFSNHEHSPPLHSEWSSMHLNWQVNPTVLSVLCSLLHAQPELSAQHQLRNIIWRSGLHEKIVFGNIGCLYKSYAAFTQVVGQHQRNKCEPNSRLWFLHSPSFIKGNAATHKYAKSSNRCKRFLCPRFENKRHTSFTG